MASWYDRAILTEEPIPQPNGTTLLTTRVNTVPLMSEESRKKLSDQQGIEVKERYLTSGERRLLFSIFGTQLDYSRIIVDNNIKPGRHLISANGRISVPPKDYDENYDFSKSKVFFQSWLVHEAAHLWQEKNLPEYHFLKAADEQVEFGEEVYDYIPDSRLKLTDYRYEQQARVIEHFFLMLRQADHLVAPNKNPANPRGNRDLREYQWLVRQVIPEPFFIP